MTLEDFFPDAPNGSLKVSSGIEGAAGRCADRDETMIDGDEPQLSLPPVAVTATDSDYGDFASDEEEIINSLLGDIAPPSQFTDAPLLVTDIEDYEGPMGVRLPKVLGVERSTPLWIQYWSKGQALRDNDSSSSTSHCLVHIASLLTH